MLIPLLKKWHPHYILRRRLESQGPNTVQAGPFKGMKYGNEACLSAIFPKLIGTYEMELHEAVAKIVRLNPGTIIDIGAAEGYYACGLARCLPRAKVIAFEVDLKARYLLEATIGMNQLREQIVVKGFCNHEGLNTTLGNATPPAVVICDAEGHEYDLLSPERVPALKYSHVLVETHDFYLPRITDVLMQRFEPTHRIKKIVARDRSPADFPYRRASLFDSFIPQKYFLFFVDERRPGGMCWLWMEPEKKWPVNSA